MLLASDDPTAPYSLGSLSINRAFLEFPALSWTSWVQPCSRPQSLCHASWSLSVRVNLFLRSIKLSMFCNHFRGDGGPKTRSCLQACITDVEDALVRCRNIGYPCMLKASAGGGGKGIRK
eukprot:scaffold108427_cov15-Tisochrysis_lutea.AAC.1